MTAKKRNNYYDISDILEDDFISLNDANFRELRVCESGPSDCLSVSSEYHFNSIIDAVEYLEENKINSYLISICCKKEEKI